MTKKRRGHPGIEDVLARPWCYYCERDFDDQKILLNHQKAKHFKCEKCGRRLNTAGGLSVHLNQVHKENLTVVENALPNRNDPSVEIFGMVGIPEDIEQQHKTRVTQQFYEAEAERRAVTGNPAPGSAAATEGAKRAKVESSDDLKKRLAEFRAKKAAKAEGADSGDATPTGTGQESKVSEEQSPSHFQSIASPSNPQYPDQQSPAQPSYPQPYTQSGYPMSQPHAYPAQNQPMYGQPVLPYSQFSQTHQYPHHGGPPPVGQYYGAASPPPGQFSQNPYPSPTQTGAMARPPSLPPAPGLPQRPSLDAPPVNAFQMQQMHNGHVPGTPTTNQQTPTSATADPRIRAQQARQPQDISASASDVDDLIADAAKNAGAIPESSKSEQPKTAEQPPEKKSKKEKETKETRLVYANNDLSPEERMAGLSKYTFDPTLEPEPPILGDAGGPMVTGTVADEDDVGDPAD